jgi:nucleotide-binding universal stress UspA family protein
MAEVSTILFPTDFSEHSNKAFPYAALLAKTFGARIILLHVSELEEADPANPEHSFAALAAFDGELVRERVTVRGHAPYKDILDVSREKNCDLIVMATHGRSALAQFFLGGSVAEEVSRFSTIPVFTVRVDEIEPAESYAGHLREILFTTDLSAAAARAFPYALLFAQRFGARLYALHVIDDDSAPLYAARSLVRDAADFPAQVEALLRQHISSLPVAEAAVSAHVAEGRAEDEIIRFAKERGIDLIAMATHGHRGLREELLGSTTDHVIREAPCPVMTVRG